MNAPGSTGRRARRPMVAGLLAVLALFLTALDDLLAAVAGARPLRFEARELAEVIAETYRRAGAVDADVIEDDDEGEHRV